jgi:hypothetical protein
MNCNSNSPFLIVSLFFFPCFCTSLNSRNVYRSTVYCIRFVKRLIDIQAHCDQGHYVDEARDFVITMTDCDVSDSSEEKQLNRCPMVGKKTCKSVVRGLRPWATVLLNFLPFHETTI